MSGCASLQTPLSLMPTASTDTNSFYHGFAIPWWPDVHTVCGHSADQPLHHRLPHNTEKKSGEVGEKSSFLAWVCWSTTRSVCRKTVLQLYWRFAFVLGKRNALYLLCCCVAIDLFIVAQPLFQLALTQFQRHLLLGRQDSCLSRLGVRVDNKTSSTTERRIVLH